MLTFLCAVPALIATAVLFGAYRAVRHWHRAGRAWRSGLTAEAECLRVHPMTRGGGDRRVHTRLRHVYEFRTREGGGYGVLAFVSLAFAGVTVLLCVGFMVVLAVVSSALHI